MQSQSQAVSTECLIGEICKRLLDWRRMFPLSTAGVASGVSSRLDPRAAACVCCGVCSRIEELGLSVSRLVCCSSAISLNSKKKTRSDTAVPRSGRGALAEQVSRRQNVSLSQWASSLGRIATKRSWSRSHHPRHDVPTKTLNDGKWRWRPRALPHGRSNWAGQICAKPAQGERSRNTRRAHHSNSASWKINSCT